MKIGIRQIFFVSICTVLFDTWGENMQQNFNELIYEICDEEGISFELLSNNWIIHLSKDRVHNFIIGTTFPINSATLSKICSDKYATYSILKKLDIPVIQHMIVFNKNRTNEYVSDVEDEDIEDYFKTHSKLIVKANVRFKRE